MGEVSGLGVSSMDLVDALGELDRRIRIHLPSSEAGVRETLAQTIRETLASPPGDVEVEASFGLKRHDVLIHSSRTAIELKFHRETPGGRNRPLTMQYGQLLADVRKLAANTFLSGRVLLLLTDRAGLIHLKNKPALPGSWGSNRAITASQVAALAQSASGPATAEGPWIDVDVRLIWQIQHKGMQLHGLAWEVKPLLRG